ncbi:MAG: response regulator [Elusimicrobia bacterium]|nr:response regulator [Elusimicrobiota bacterium]
MTDSSAGRRILLIDDDESLRELFLLAMAKDFNAVVAEDGVKGLAKVAAFKPHLIVLDLMMPRLDGFAVIHKLQAAGFADIPVIVITGYSDQANENIVSEEPNVVAFLHKPLRFDELIARIKSQLAA